MEAFLARQGIDLDEFRKAMGSFAVQSNTRRAAVLAKRFDVRAVPAVGVDGKYLISGQGAANTIKVMDYLIGMEREKKTAQAAK
jgi:thiol:disulfide interchange protein DsbA